jgi:hypothetical protein
MTLRFAVLATFIAVLPFSVDAPTDSAGRHGQTRVEAMGALGQYGIVTRGCNNQLISVVHRQLRSGALVVEHETPAGVVLGVRGGQVRESQEPRIDNPPSGILTPVPGWALTNRYVNPFVAYESRWAGMGLGYLNADHRFLVNANHSFLVNNDDRFQPDVTGHVRFGDREGTSYSLRFMEDVPLQSEGNLSMELAFHSSRGVEWAALAGIGGPYDGTLIGLKGRFWITPEAAAQVRLAVGAQNQYSLSAGVRARWPARR